MGRLVSPWQQATAACHLRPTAEMIDASFPKNEKRKRNERERERDVAAEAYLL